MLAAAIGYTWAEHTAAAVIGHHSLRRVAALQKKLEQVSFSSRNAHDIIRSRYSIFCDSVTKVLCSFSGCAHYVVNHDDKLARRMYVTL